MSNETKKNEYLKNIDILKNYSKYDDFTLIFSILDTDSFESSDDFNLLIEFLTGYPTPIREAVSQKLEDYIGNYENYFLSEFSKNKILDAIIDINPNVSRSICSILEKSLKLSQILEESIILRLNELILNIKIFEKSNKDDFLDSKKNIKNHAKNKKLFSLYWYLEALACCYTGRYSSEVLKILNYTLNFTDYTIREKTAKILAKVDAAPYELLQKANNDQNFYVKIQVYDKINNED